jgi:hypothetical protein
MQTISQSARTQVAIMPANLPATASNNAVDRIRASLSTTPGKMRAWIFITAVTLFLATVSGVVAYANLKDVVQTIGRDTAPSIVAAERLRYLLADTHANALNAVLLKENDGGQNTRAFHTSMEAAHVELVNAAKNITYGDEEQKPITDIMHGLATYDVLIGKVRGKGGEAALPDLLAADRLMQGSILPASERLDHANFAHMTQIHNLHEKRFHNEIETYVALVVFAFAVILANQEFLIRKTHRTVNLGYAAATIVFVLCSCYSFFALRSIESGVREMKLDAFNSVHSLSKARALAYQSNANESLYLIYHGHPQEQKRAAEDFNNHARTILTAGEGAHQGKYTGLLAEELANITYAGEREAASTALDAWHQYEEIDGRIRKLEASGRYNDAIALNVGRNTNESNWAFDRFDEALSKTITINQSAFERTVESSFAHLRVLPYVLVASLIACIAAVVFGMKPRLDEYRF